MNTKHTKKESFAHCSSFLKISFVSMEKNFSSQQERRHRNKENEKSKQNYNNNSP